MPVSPRRRVGGRSHFQESQAIIFTLQCYYQEVLLFSTSFSASFLTRLETDTRAYVLSIISSKYSSCLKGKGGHWEPSLVTEPIYIYIYVSEWASMASGFKDTAWWAGKTLRPTKLPLTLRARNLIDSSPDLWHHLFLTRTTHLHTTLPGKGELEPSRANRKGKEKSKQVRAWQNHCSCTDSFVHLLQLAL